MQRLRAAPAHPSNVLPAFLVSAAPRFCDSSLRLASFLSASATVTGHTLVLAVVPSEDSGVRPSLPRPSFQLSPSLSLTRDPPAVPRPSPHPVPLQLGLQAPGWSHPPALGSSLPASAALTWQSPAGIYPRPPHARPPPGSLPFWRPGQPHRVHRIRPVTCSRTQVPSLPPSLLPSTLASILHSGSLPSAYKRVFFPPPRPVLWFSRFGYGHRPRCSSLAFSHTRAPFRPLPSRLHLVKIIHDLLVGTSHGRSSLMALSAASSPRRGSYILPVVPAATGLWPPL